MSQDSTTADLDAEATIDRLHAARDRLRSVEGEVDDLGEAGVNAAANAVRNADRLLANYADSAVGTGDFESYVRFQEEFATLVEGLDDDVPRREAFEDALEAIDKRRLKESDFDRAREALAPARDLLDLLERREEARDGYRETYREAQRRLSELDEAVADLERLRRLGEADLDAPVERLRDPVEAYNEAVREDFRAFKAEASAREVLAFVASTGAYPLVDARQPPADLLTYVEEYPAGEEPVPDLLAYADYSASKLDHYVDDPGALRARVATHRTYLERLDADPYTVAWPPGPAAEVRHRTDELLSLLRGVVDESTAASLRRVQGLTRRDDYQRLRTAAEAMSELTDEERERLASGDAERDLDRAREARERLADELADLPEP